MFRTIFAASLLAATLAAPAAADAANTMPVRLHRYTAPLYAWNVNSYWLEGKDGVVLIDAQLLRSDAHYLAAEIKASGKPLKGVLITHAHLDHIGGLTVLRAELGDFPVYATAATKAAMPDYIKEVHKYYDMPNQFGEALADTYVEPDHLIKAGDTLTIAGIELQVFGGGPGEAKDNVSFYAPALKAVFAGDMSYPFCHFYAGEAHPWKALAQLKAMRAKFADDLYVYAGHNNPARVAQLDDQVGYLTFLIDTTKAAMADSTNIDVDGTLTPKARRVVLDAILAKYPHFDTFGYKPAELVPGSIYGVEKAIVAQRQTAG